MTPSVGTSDGVTQVNSTVNWLVAKEASDVANLNSTITSTATALVAGANALQASPAAVALAMPEPHA